MKKIVFLFLVVACTPNSHAQAKKMKFYYYPSSNVYYNTSSGKYIYSNNGSWTTVNTLPSTIAIAHNPRIIVYDTNPRVWEKNKTHQAKYKAAKLKPMPPGQIRKVRSAGKH